MMHTIADLLEALEAASPDFARARAEHTRYHDDVLPYVLLEDDLRPWLASHITSDRSQLESVLSVLEEAFLKGNEDVKTLIAIALLEGLGRDAAMPRERELRERLGPALKGEIRRMEAWNGAPPT
jgi:hypothetical protein